MKRTMRTTMMMSAIYESTMELIDRTGQRLMEGWEKGCLQCVLKGLP